MACKRCGDDLDFMNGYCPDCYEIEKELSEKVRERWILGKDVTYHICITLLRDRYGWSRKRAVKEIMVTRHGMTGASHRPRAVTR